MRPQFTIFVALSSLSLFSGSAISSKITYPSCTSLDYIWTYNSLAQNPCEITAYLQGTCNHGVFSVHALPAPGDAYSGPESDVGSDLCKCNTIVYNLLSACGACQGAEWITWSHFIANCTSVFQISSFPNPVPNGTYVPQWALLDVTLENSWNPNKSMSTGVTPEIPPGVLIGPSSTSSGTSTRTAAPSGSTSSDPTASPTSKGKNSNTGTIVGGVVGGIAVIATAVFGNFYLRRRRTGTSGTPPSEGAPSPPFDGEPQPQKGYVMEKSDDSSHTSSLPPAPPMTPMRVYNPNDPMTFPKTVTTTIHESQQDAGNPSATTQDARPHGYHGLPLV